MATIREMPTRSTKFERLTEVGAKSSLRYAAQILSLAAQHARTLGHEKVMVEDVDTVDSLFMNITEATEYLKKYEEKFMKH